MKTLGGKIIIVIGIIHTLIGLIFGLDILREIFLDGFFNAIEPHLHRMYWFWFMITGFLIILIGQLIQSLQLRSAPLPRYIGWEIVVFGVLASLAIPASGGWLVIGAGIYLLLKDKKKLQHSGVK